MRLDIGSPTQVRGYYDKLWLAAQPGLDFAKGLKAFRQIGIPEGSLFGRRVLDAGCGTGVPAVVMAKHLGAQVTAVDLEPTCIELTRRLAEENGVTIKTRVGDVTNLSDGEGTFDTVVSVGVAHHTGNALGCFRTFHRMLKPGGECFVSLIRLSPLVFLQGFLHRVYRLLPSPLKPPMVKVVCLGTWMATRFSRNGQSRFTPLWVGVWDALACPYHQVETDQGWCRLLKEAGFEEVAFLRAWNLWGHHGLYYGRKARGR